MSIMAESNVYESMADDGLNEKLCLAACETSSAFMFIPKIERNVEGVMQRGISEEVMGEKRGILHDGIIIQDTYNSMGEPPIYYEEALSACEEVEVDYKPSLSSMMLPINKIEEDWGESGQFHNSTMDSSYDDNEVPICSYTDDTENVDDSDEETIATFLTAAGQTLALYAVEDSDEVFAVAVYDESGEPPTNFQFLMKSDVERLIGEGAVKTVKKPTQIKKQVFSTDGPVFTQTMEEEVRVEEPNVEECCIEEPSFVERSFEEPAFEEPAFEETSFEDPSFDETSFEEPCFEEIQLKSEFVEVTQHQNKQYNTHNITYSEDNNSSSTEIVQETERISSPLPAVDKQHEFTYVLMDKACPASATDEIEAKSKTVKTTPEIKSNHSEFIEQSTVQYILLDEDSDSELTLADIEETLKNHKSINNNKSLLKNTYKTGVDSPQDNFNGMSLSSSDVLRDDLQTMDIPIVAPKPLNFPKKPYKTANSGRKTSSLICRRENFIDERFNVSSGTSLLISNSDGKSSEPKTSSLENVQTGGSRVKRSRKQQLTSVNREDSEIIIQPANFDSEEDEPTKKRGRGKRKPGRPPIYKKTTMSKKINKSMRLNRTVELIEIDVDEADRLQGKQDIEEITIDENKEKGSSDKENEVIMVGDSEDEAQQAEMSKTCSTSNLKCNHCLRNFRQQRALETHSRVCPKSPEFVRRMNEKTARRNSARSNDSPAVKKSYACKICKETFDVVVVLARHVRAMHSQKKKVNSSNLTTARAKTPESPPSNEQSSSNSVTSDDDTNFTPDNPRTKTKMKIKNSKRSWKSKKLHCDDCGRWFTSDALLTAHSLQHATKKSEKQTRRCMTCKKVFKSRLLYIRHMRMHSKAKQLQKKLHHTRQATGKTTAVRKRGRPRKL